MSLHVQGQVVAAGERPRAEVALEGLRPRVLAVVPRQLVGAGKLPAAAVPGALVRLLARVRPLVRLEVRALRVDLPAVREEAAVNPLLVLARRTVGRITGRRRRRRPLGASILMKNFLRLFPRCIDIN